MIGLSCTAGAVLALCGQVRGTLERKGLPQKELDGGRVRIEPRYNQGSGFGLVPLNGRQMAPLSLAALWALLGVCGGRGLGPDCCWAADSATCGNGSAMDGSWTICAFQRRRGR